MGAAARELITLTGEVSVAAENAGVCVANNLADVMPHAGTAPAATALVVEFARRIARFRSSCTASGADTFSTRCPPYGTFP
jgi:hypothetical protein